MLTEIKNDVEKTIRRVYNRGKKVNNKQESWKFTDYCDRTRAKLVGKYMGKLDNRYQNYEYRLIDFIEDLKILDAIRHDIGMKFL